MIELSPSQLKSLKNSNILFSYDTAGRHWIDDGVLSMPGPEIVAEDFAIYATRTHFHSIGAFSYSGSPLPRFVRIGRYCSIAGGVEVMPNSHPTNLFTTSPMVYDNRLSARVRFYANEGYENDDCVRGLGHPSNERPIEIGNDVYVATGVRLRGGITIGNGAIVGAYTVVTKSVPPYSVVAGNPARVVRMRYSDSQIEALEKLRWWDWDFRSVLAKTDIQDIDRFIAELPKLTEAGEIKPFAPGRNCLADLLATA